MSKCTTILNLVKDEALRLMSKAAYTENLQVVKLSAREGSTFLRSILEHGSEVLSYSSSCSKARNCKACLGFL